MELSTGVIADITEGGTPEGPVLQILGIRRVPSDTQERYRLIVSDGQWSSSFAMLCTQYNGVVASGVIGLHCIIQVHRYVCSTVQVGKKVLIIMDCEVLKSGADVGQKIGDPQLYDKHKNESSVTTHSPKPVDRASTSPEPCIQNEAASPSYISSPMTPTQMVNNSSLSIQSTNQTNIAASSACTIAPTQAHQTLSSVKTSSFGRVKQPSASALHYVPNIAGSITNTSPPTTAYQSQPPPKRYKPNVSATTASTLPSTPSYKSPPSAQHYTQNTPSSPVNTPPLESDSQQTPLPQRYTTNVASSTANTQRRPRFRPIESLSPYQNKFTIRARVTNKSDVKTWSNQRGQGRLFSVVFLDESGEIRATGFNEELDKFYNILEENKVYFVRNGTIKDADKKYNDLNHDYEMTFNRMTEIAICEDENSVPQTQFDFMPISEISNVEKDSVIDVIGVVKDVSEVQIITARATGREVKKRDIQLMDNSMTEITLTLWDTQAENFDGNHQPIVAIKRVKVGDFNGKNLSMLQSSIMQINPDIEEAHRLRNWFDHGGSQQDLTNISSQLGMTGTGSIGTDFKTFAEARLENLGAREEPDYFDMYASVVNLKMENCLYTACPLDTCKRKVIDLRNGKYRCEKCNQEYDSFKWRFILSCNLSDATDSNWVKCFGVQAETLMGITAQQLGVMRETNYENFENVFRDANFNKYKFRLKIRTEIFNGETKLATTVVAIAQLDPLSYNKQLISEIEQMAEQALLNQMEP